MRSCVEDLQNGPFPCTDAWGWLYRTFERLAPAGGPMRRAVCRYFCPTFAERWRSGCIYRFLGVHVFGAVIPTGGVVVRRVTKTQMAPYTLAGNSLRAARAFYHRTCVFEALHLPFLVVLAGLSVHRTVMGRPVLALENALVNLVANVYPVMHQRRTRTRITTLLARSAARRASH